MVKAFDRELARELINSLDFEWVKEVGSRDNQITQVLEFITAIGGYSLSEGQHSSNGQSISHLVESLLDDTLPRLSEIRSIRALATCLTALYRVADTLDSAEIEERGWNAVRMRIDVISRALENSNDIVGCGLISLLMTRLRRLPLAAGVVDEARALVLDVAAQHPVMPSLFALALVGANASDVESRRIMSQLRDLQETKTWEIGFANWLHAQRSYAESKNAEYPMIGLEAFEKREPHHLLRVFDEESQRAGNNLRFAFVLASVSQLGVHLLDDSEELVDVLYREAAGRSRLEPRYWVRQLVDEFAEKLNHEQSVLEERGVVMVALSVRDLSPRIEAVAGLDEPEDLCQSILGTESSDLAS